MTIFNLQIVTESGILSFSPIDKNNFKIEHLDLDGLPKQYNETIFIDSIDDFIIALHRFKALNRDNNE